MSSPIAYQEPKRARLIVLFVLSIGAHVGLAFLAIWGGKFLGPPLAKEELLDAGMDVVLGDPVQELIVAQNTPVSPEPPTPEPPPPPPEPEPPEPPPPEPEPEPVMEEPEFIEPKPEPKATPAPKLATPRPDKPKSAATKTAAAPPGAKTGPTPRPGVVGGNVTEGALTGTPGGRTVGTQWKTPDPPYPRAALAARIQGPCTVRVATDSGGNVVQVTIVRPVHPILDANTRTFLRGNWKGPPNTSRTRTFNYVMR